MERVDSPVDAPNITPNEGFHHLAFDRQQPFISNVSRALKTDLHGPLALVVLISEYGNIGYT